MDETIILNAYSIVKWSAYHTRGHFVNVLRMLPYVMSTATL